jgi:CRISPR/Cas system CSM-associated protein Csm3 (group 7 of RAMP superfamily)
MSLHAKLFTGRIKFGINLESPLLIKSGGSVGLSPLAPDMECIRTMREGESQVYIPGTSLKGVIRAHATRLVAKHEQAMFGDTGNAGRFYFADAYAASNTIPTLSIRSNTAINPRSGAAKRGSLRSFEVVTSGTFVTQIDWINISLSQLGLLLLVLNELHTKTISLGSGGSKGMGAVSIQYDTMIIRYPSCIFRNGRLYSCKNNKELDTQHMYGFKSLSTPNQTDVAPLINLSYQATPGGLGVQLAATNEQDIMNVRNACLQLLVNEMGGAHA